MEIKDLEINYSNGVEKNIILEIGTDACGQEFLTIHYSNYKGGYTPGFALGKNYEEADFAFDITNRFSKDLLRSDMLFKNLFTGIVSNEPIFPSIYLGTKASSLEDFNKSLANSIKLIEEINYPYFLAKDGMISSKRNERVADYIKEADEIYFAQEKKTLN